MKLEGKVALIPGGTSGIGEQIAYAFARERATVVVASRNKAKVDRVAAEIGKIGKGAGLVLDVTDQEKVEEAVAWVVKEYGKLDIMLNSAGFFPATPVEKISGDEWRRVIDINLNGPSYCAMAAARAAIFFRRTSSG